MQSLLTLLDTTRIIPVVTVNSVDDGLRVCQALQDGGLNAVEVTLRTPAAISVIEALKDQMQDFLIGAGTIKSVEDLESVKNAGAEFAVSPGFTRELSGAAFDLNLPLLPGVATASEVLEGMSAGRYFFKLFPAEAVGGLALLKSLGAPFKEVKFCPTGGINAGNFKDYLALPNVACVGGSWMVAPALIENHNWSEITRLSRLAVTDGISG